MKVDFNSKVLNLDGEPMKRDAAPDSPDATMRDIIETALIPPKTTLVNGERLPVQESVAEHVTKYKLLKKVHRSGEQEITSEEGTLIKERVAIAGYNNVTVGAVIEFIDGPLKD